MYKQLSDDKNLTLEVPDIEYVIYVYLRYHRQRNLRYTSTLYSSPDLRYKKTKKKGQLIEQKPFFTLPFYTFYTVKYIQDKISTKKVKEEIKYGDPLLIDFIMCSYHRLQIMYPKVKFIFLEYPDGTFSLPENLKQMKDNEGNISEQTKKIFKENGIIYINAEELVGHELRDIDKYRSDDKEHPNGQAWKEVSEALIKKFNL